MYTVHLLCLRRSKHLGPMQPGYTHRTVLFDGLQSAKVPQLYLVCGELVSLRLDFFKKVIRMTWRTTAAARRNIQARWISAPTVKVEIDRSQMRELYLKHNEVIARQEEVWFGFFRKVFQHNLGSASGFEIWAKCTFCILLHPFASFLQCKYVRPFSFLSWIHNLSSNGNAARMNEIHMFRNLFHPNLWSLSIEMETFRHFGCALRFPLWVLGCEWQELLRQAVGERLFQRPGETFDRRKRRCFV